MKWFCRSHASHKVTENSTIRQNAYEFLLTYHINHIPLLHHVLAIARY